MGVGERDLRSDYSVEDDGDFKDFEFRLVSKADYPVVEEHLKTVFARGEPILERVGYSPELANDVWHVAKLGLDKNSGLSFCAIHKPTQKLAGLRVTYRIEKDEQDPEMQYQSALASYVYHNIHDQESKANICKRYGISYYAELLSASVDPEFREQGLASEMYRRMFLLLRAKGYPAAQSLFSSPITRKVAAKIGFEEVNRRYFKDFTTPDGMKFITNAEDDQYAALMTIKL